MFLVEKMGFGWESVHDIAEQIEHIRSPEFFERMNELLGYPKIDPHGSPIPDRNGKMEAETIYQAERMQSGRLHEVMCGDQYLGGIATFLTPVK